jgi:hypothetical protein
LSSLCFITWSDNYRNIVSQPARDRWLDLYILEVRDDILKGLNKDFKMNNDVLAKAYYKRSKRLFDTKSHAAGKSTRQPENPQEKPSI